MSKFQKKVIDKYKKEGFTVINIIKLSASGYPDLLILKPNGISMWVEIKEKNDTLKELQKYRIDQLRELGFEAFCLKDGIGKIY